MLDPLLRRSESLLRCHAERSTIPPPASTCYPCGETTPTQHAVGWRGSYAHIIGRPPLSSSAKEEGSVQDEDGDQRLEVTWLLLNSTQM
ncbi:hypothetical protein Y032_0212g2263 [Ancylostoma ceylanicum]|uniref:Uncharacterized protein n=1 Tax=Ancylostoma ceylanicum TaxID=53326 RepID=A0A016SKX6_9BILA|nr:hypothetical protein Y032_0212g2263 [Ancylostoma ceylanicum]